MLKKALHLFVVMSCLGSLSFGQTSTPSIVPITKEPSHHLVLENEYVRVFKVEVAPHSETLYHKHDVDYVFVTLGDSDVDSVRVGEPPVRLHLKDGDTRFTKGGFAHKAVNNSDKPFVNVTVELKKSPGQIECVSGTDKDCNWWSIAMTDMCHSPRPVLIASNLTISRECVFKTRNRPVYTNALYIRAKTERVAVTPYKHLVEGTGRLEAGPAKATEIEIKWFKQDSEAVFEGEPDSRLTYVVLSFPRIGTDPSFKNKNTNN